MLANFRNSFKVSHLRHGERIEPDKVRRVARGAPRRRFF
jgi:hypothetical protein